MRVLIWSLFLALGCVLSSSAGAKSVPAAPSALQGERMLAGRDAGVVARDPRADGGRLIRLTGRGAATARLRAAGSARVSLRVGGQGCQGEARMIVTLDGARLLTRVVRGRALVTVSPKKSVAAGLHVLRLRLANPHRGGRCVRALRVDRVALRVTTPGSDEPIWRPAPKTTWQWQLSGAIDQSLSAQMFDIDLDENPASLVASLHARGKRVVCYLSAGSLEDVRPDAARFPAEVLGEAVGGWPHERWLDVRRLDVLGPIMERRLDQCRAKGFDGVEADNVDGYQNKTGFALSTADQLRYNRFLAREAHARGLSIGLKNDLAQVEALEPDFDWALNEECFRYDECEALTPFIRAGKAVFNVEYGVPTAAFCDKANALGLMSMRKTLALDASRTACW